MGDVFIGFDPREMRASRVAETSLRQWSPDRTVTRISRALVPAYQRPTTYTEDGLIWDDLSHAPMSTDHAIARFFVPHVMGHTGWALFTDGDVLFRRDVAALFALADPQYAVQVVQHPPLLTEGTKKTGQPQLAYPRKNWSSVMLWNCAHPAHQALTLQVLNQWPGRQLHAFAWLDDALIGALPPAWNHLVGISPVDPDAAIVHYTLGTPDLPGHERDAFADEWFAALALRTLA